MPAVRAARPSWLSKSKLLSWLQCPKRLWLETYRPKVAPTSQATERQFKLGHDVGGMAQRLQRTGVLVGSRKDLPKALAETSAHMAARTTVLFEPAFRYGNVLVRVDILKRRGNRYQVREVKASGSVKDHHLPDTAIQAWVLRGAGVKVDSVLLQHIDTDFVYRGGGDYRGLFTEESVDDDIRSLKKDVPPWVAEAQATLAGGEPKRETGKHCEEPYACPCFDYCSSKDPQTRYPLRILPNIGKRLPELVAEGYRDVREIPAGRLTEHQERVRRISKSGKPELSPDARKALRGLPYPRYHLDFETVNFAIPIWPGTTPFQQIPFQWSCHVERSSGKLEHYAHLDTSGEAPMAGIAESLVATLGERGPIIAYGAGFEKARLEALADLVPRHRRGLRKLSGRLVDLLALTKTHYYHPAMMGSWSLKDVLPTIAPELDYENVGEVQDGGEASAAYEEIISPETSGERKAELRTALERYCERDTLATVRIARFLEKGK